MYNVYIIELENGEYYTGYTTNIKKRIQYHFNELVPTTKRTKPKLLVFTESFIDKKKALDFEKYIKQGSGFAFSKKHFL